MVDIQASTAAATQQQLQIYFGGAFDQSVMGAPVYFWAMFMEGMAIFCLVVLIVYYRWWILDKIWDFVYCYRKRLPLALIRNRSRQAHLKALRYVAQIFEDESGPDKWYATALDSAQTIAGTPLVDACDYYDWLQDPIINQAIVEIVQAWNHGIPNPNIEPTKNADGSLNITYISGKEPHPEEEKIYDPIRFQELLGSGKLKDYFDSTEVVEYKKGSVKIPAYFIIDISKVEQYLPKSRSSAMFGGYTQWLAEQTGNKDRNDSMTFLKYVAIGITALIIAGLIAGIISGAI